MAVDMDALWMRPYDQGTSCPACQYASVETRFFDTGYSAEARQFFNGVTITEQCLGRKCRRCGCAWPEALVTPAPETHNE